MITMRSKASTFLLSVSPCFFGLSDDLTVLQTFRSQAKDNDDAQHQSPQEASTEGQEDGESEKFVIA